MDEFCIYKLEKTLSVILSQRTGREVKVYAELRDVSDGHNNGVDNR